MRNKCFLAFVFCYLLLVSCQRNRTGIDISDVNVEIKIKRMERELFSADSFSIGSVHPGLQKKYGTFYQRYIENIAGVGTLKDPEILVRLNLFLFDKYVREVYNDTEKKFDDALMDIHSGLTDAFKRTHYFFPQLIIPEVITFVSGFQYAVVVTDSALGIGLDMYLGKDYENYTKAGLPFYKILQMEREFIVPDAMKSWLMTEFFSEKDMNTNDMLETMVLHGKIMYLLEVVLPQTADTLHLGYTAAQLKWCEENEFNIWAHLVDNELLYTKNMETITKFFNDAPFTSGLPKESPSRAGVWIGRQIVRSFMENNSEISIPELFKITNAQELLRKSKYKPVK